MSAPDLKQAGRAYLQRWSTWLQANPDADPDVVRRAMATGEPPPDLEARQAAARERIATAEAEREQRIRQSTSVVSGLSAMQRTFLVRYLLHGNATRAADEAGYAWPDKQGSQLRHKPHIQAAIDEYFHQAEMSARETVARLSQQARGEYAAYLRPVVDDHGRTVDLDVDLEKMLADGNGHLIRGYTSGRDGRVQVHFYDAQTALRMVGEYHALFKQTTAGDPERPLQHEHKFDLSDVPTEVLAAMALRGVGPPDKGEEDGNT